MAVSYITGPYPLIAEEIVQALVDDAPPGWVAFTLATEIADSVKPPPKKRRRRKKGEDAPKKKPDTPIRKMEQMFGGQQEPGKPQPPPFAKGTQILRKFDAGVPVYYRDPLNFPNGTIAIQVQRIRGELTAKGWLPGRPMTVKALWWVHPPYQESDLERKFADDHERDLDLLRAYVAGALRSNPNLDFDYAQLARDYPTIPRNHLRAIVARERARQNVVAPQTKNQREKILELKRKGLKLPQIVDELVVSREEIDPAYVRKVYKRGEAPDYKRRQREIEKRDGRVVPIKSLRAREAEKKAVETPVDPETPGLSPSRLARELLRRGASYEDVEKRLEERGMPLARKGLRALKSQLPKEK